MMTDLTQWLRGQTRVILTETQRMLVLDHGRFSAVLGPGEHWLPRNHVSKMVFDITERTLQSDYGPALLQSRPDLAEGHLTQVTAGPGEVAVLSLNDVPSLVLGPGDRVILWDAAGHWSEARFDLTVSHQVPATLAPELERAGLLRDVIRIEIDPGRVGMLTVDGVFDQALAPGKYWFWAFRRTHVVKVVDTRWLIQEVNGQEILTADRVTLRVNLSAAYRVTDPILATTRVKDFGETLYRALQLAFRRTLGALTLDQILAEKVAVDDDAAQAVRTDMAAIGIEVGEIAVKDVILPGDMRDILNQVVTAQKEAEANVIRRREETNATRSLLNTAKVMADNPVMLRLKELEALETIAQRVDRLTVHNGTQGLMGDIVRLTDS